MKDGNNAQDSNQLGKGEFGVLLLVLLGVSGFLGFMSSGFEETQFATGAGDRALTALGTLFIIALFVERAQQVYISAWRKLGREQIEDKISRLQEKIAEESDPQNGSDFREELAELKRGLLEYRHRTRQLAFLGGITLGILISLAGPRILAEVVVVYGPMGAWQAPIFNGMDILITGGLIGGGSDGIHKLVTLITDFLDKTRERTRSAPKNQEG